MTRRLILGKHSGGFRMRTSRAGADALSASLSDVLFDSDHIPVVAQAVQEVTMTTPGLAPTISVSGRVPPASVSFTHGLGFVPIVACIAKPLPIAVVGGTAEQWRLTVASGVTWVNQPVPGWDAYVGKWMTPFWINGTLSNGAPFFWGWWVEADASQVTFKSDNDPLRVRFSLLEP